MAAPIVNAAIKRLLPLMDRILVKKADALKQTTGGIVLPDKAVQPVIVGTVVAIGPGQRTNAGAHIKPAVRVGDEVLLSKYGGTMITMDDESELHLYRESDILAKIET